MDDGENIDENGNPNPVTPEEIERDHQLKAEGYDPNDPNERTVLDDESADADPSTSDPDSLRPRSEVPPEARDGSDIV